MKVMDKMKSGIKTLLLAFSMLKVRILILILFRFILKFIFSPFLQWDVLDGQ
jgi:hypothetical protein